MTSFGLQAIQIFSLCFQNSNNFITVHKVDTLFPCSESDVCQQPDGLPLLWTNQSPRPIFDPTTFPDDDFSGSYVFSANYDLVAYRVKYEKRWRHSYKASYQVYKTKYFNNDNGEAVEEKLVLIENVWLFSFEPRLGSTIDAIP